MLNAKKFLLTIFVQKTKWGDVYKFCGTQVYRITVITPTKFNAEGLLKN